MRDSGLLHIAKTLVAAGNTGAALLVAPMIKNSCVRDLAFGKIAFRLAEDGDTREAFVIEGTSTQSILKVGKDHAMCTPVSRGRAELDGFRHPCISR